MRENDLHRTRASVVVLDKNKRCFLLMYRKINEVEKYVLIGGGTEEGESIEKTAVREAKEETNLDVKLSKKLTEIKYKNCTDHVFIAEKFSGKLKLSGEEKYRSKDGNIYSPEWVKLDDLNKISIPIYPRFIVNLIKKEFYKND